jgi:hypothetical protein
MAPPFMHHAAIFVYQFGVVIEGFNTPILYAKK